MPSSEKTAQQTSFARLLAIMHRLRAPGGCPWDREQTHESLKPYLIEEAYEVIEAMETGTDNDLRDELGDLLLQVVFHCELAEERGAFTIDDVSHAVTEKLIRRHPHVFGQVKVESSKEVLANWSRIKAAEKHQKKAGPEGTLLLAGLPRAMPALLRAHRLGERVAQVGFDWPNAHECRKKILEEIEEVDMALDGMKEGSVHEELGDLLFAMASYIRLLGTNAESVLHAALSRFQKRFSAVEKDLAARGLDLHDASKEELDAAWQRAKQAKVSARSAGSDQG